MPLEPAMHVLLINPNTRADLTAELTARAQQALADTGVRVIGATAPFGDDYIASERSYVLAAHAVVDAWQAHVLAHGRPVAVLVACFGDPGVWALREVSGLPVMGLAEAAMREAQAIGPFGIVTGGQAWGPMLMRLARCLQLAGPGGLQRVETVEATGGELAAAPDAGAQALGQACERVLAASDAGSVALGALILGGAALAGWVPRLQPMPGLPVVDSVEAGERWLCQQVARLSPAG
jgi:Asp/Glu/hydantoin racemase